MTRVERVRAACKPGTGEETIRVNWSSAKTDVKSSDAASISDGGDEGSNLRILSMTVMIVELV